MRLSRDHLWSANAGALGTSVEACQLEATEARRKPLPMLRPGLKSYFEGGRDFAEDSKGKCVHTLVFVFLDYTGYPNCYQKGDQTMKRELLKQYFTDEKLFEVALDSYYNEINRKWPITDKLRLYQRARDAFDQKIPFQIREEHFQFIYTEL